MSTTSMDRRQFFRAAGAVAAACLVGAKFTLAEEASTVNIGRLSDYPKDGMYEGFKASHGFIVVREQDRLYAMSAHCTHKGVLVKQMDGGFRCPAHGAAFSAKGIVERGPAKRSLPRLRITRGPDDSISVDPMRKFEQADWGQPDAYIDIRA